MSIAYIAEVEVRNRYGNDLIYPMNDTAKKICKALGGQKTLTRANVDDFKALGFTFKACAIVAGKPVAMGDL